MRRGDELAEVESQAPAYPLALRGGGGTAGPFGGAVRDELGRSVVRGAVRVSGYAVAAAVVYVLGRLAWRGLSAWWSGRRRTATARTVHVLDAPRRVQDVVRVDFGDDATGVPVGAERVVLDRVEINPVARRRPRSTGKKGRRA